MSLLKYRAEIDGLRALAVISVILYHSNLTINKIQLFSGGYIGVDIFFVISGFLITMIILKEVSLKKFSLINFYERRARRILPALFFVMIVSFPFAYIYSLPEAVVEFSESILSSLVFSSNFYFWLQDSYIAEASELKPFLHTWSLSVEEQFYLLFSVFLIALLKYYSKFLLIILCFVFFVSLILADYLSTNYIDFNFYSLPSRGWELLAGAILAKIKFDNKRYCASFPVLLNQLMPLIGIVFIILSIILFNDSTPHPSRLTLFPVVGAMLIIYFADEKEYVTRVLSSRLFVFIGVISYSFYLWHYPIFAFSKIADLSQSLSSKMFYIFIALILSIFSYYFIERKFRKPSGLKGMYGASFFIFSALLILAFNIYSLNSNGFSFRLGPMYADKESGDWRVNGKECHDLSFESRCVLKPHANKNKEIILIGDSFTYQYSKALKEISSDNGWGVQHLAKGGCPFILDSIRFKKGKEKIICTLHNKKVSKLLDTLPPSVIIYSANWESYNKSNISTVHKSLEQAWKKTISYLLDKKHSVIIVYPYAVGNNLPRDLLKIKSFEEREKAIGFAEVNATGHISKRSIEVTKFLDSLDHNAIFRIHPNDIICKEGCKTVISKQFTYVDGHHLNYFVTQDVATNISNIIISNRLISK